jgi:Cu2+-exporting ATPase
MAVLLTSPAPRARPASRPVCRHCGAPLTGARIEPSGFCCPGCAYVYRLINEHGLDAYYRIKDPITAPADAAVFQPRDYAWLDESCRAAEAALPGAVPHLDLDLQGVSCAGCVWLIERLFTQETGAREIVVDAQTGTLRLTWESGRFDAGGWGRRLQTFGYLVGPAGETPERLESTGLGRRIGLCAAFALNVMLFTLPVYFGMRPDFAYAGLFRLLALLFATFSVLAGGSYFFVRAVGALRARAAHIDLPIAIGIAGAYAGSLYGWFAGRERYLYFDFIATFTLLMLVGRWAQVRAIERNRLRLLRRQPLPPKIRLADGAWVARERLAAGQSILIGPGQTVPVDAQLEDGVWLFSLASINGEAEPQLIAAGRPVPAGSVNVGRADARLRTLQPWADSLLARLLAPGVRPGPRSAALERIIRGYVVGILALSFLAGVGWWLATGDPVRAGSVAIAVLVVSCPCALGLALPMAEEMATIAARSRGVFVRESSLWSRLSHVRRIVFDKTGTLTLEAPVLLNPETVDALAPEDRAALVALTRDSLHPISQCLLERLLAQGTAAVPVGTVDEVVGHGVRMGPWSLGRAGWADDGPVGVETVFACGGRELARLRFADQVRPNTAREMAGLMGRGYAVFILSGDSRDKVAALAAELGVPADHAVGAKSAVEKAAWLDSHGADETLMLGDGANDSLAFDRSQCRGTPVIHRGILESKADFYYLRRGLDGIRGLLDIDRVRGRTQRAVIAFSVVYNILATGFAVAGVMRPLVAAILMPLSSLASLLIVGWGMRRIMVPTDGADSP